MYPFRLLLTTRNLCSSALHLSSLPQMQGFFIHPLPRLSAIPTNKCLPHKKRQLKSLILRAFFCK